MTTAIVIDVMRRAIQTILLVSAPMLLVSLLVGLLVAVFQAATQINEQTLTFVPRVVAVLTIMIIAGPWAIRVLLTFTTGLINLMATL